MDNFTFCILLMLLSTAGSFIQRVCGFGFGIFIMTMLPYLMPTYQEATALSGLLSLLQSGVVLCGMWRHLHLRNMVGIFLSFCVFSYLAIRFVSVAGDGVLKIFLGCVLMLLGLYFLFFSSKVSVTPRKRWQLSLGALSGTMGGLFGMHGPAAVVYFLNSEPSKEGYLAICQAYFVATNLYMSVFRAGNGFMTEAVGWGVLVSLAGIGVGVWLGGKVFNRMPQATLKRVIYIYMIVAGVIAIATR
ncbi:MAG: sulfite exporter TauE/SafE family protein [Bacteroidales bacterium]|nr:sulfite exporter TauE/SafE family protein [Bacteroidales bacterium]